MNVEMNARVLHGSRQVTKRLGQLFALVLLAACGDDPPGVDPERGSGARPWPQRFVVLGDSIAACVGVGDENGAACSLKKLHAHLGTRGPAPSYENYAVGGAETADVPARQLARVGGGPGHALVVIYVGGNDLRPYLIAPDGAAEDGFERLVPAAEASWRLIFAHFADRARFPDGATLVVNNQYDPFDDCTAPPFFVSATKRRLLRSFNDVLARLARESGAFYVDQLTPFLGHGHHFAVRSCPHYQPGMTPFMADLVHPNAAGHDQLFAEWRKLLATLYP